MKHLFTIATLLMTLQMARAVYTEDVATNFVNQGQLVSATNGFVTSSITNGLASTNYVSSITNGLATTSVTNGLATTNYVSNYVYSATNGFSGILTSNGFGTNTTLITIFSGSTNIVATTNYTFGGNGFTVTNAGSTAVNGTYTSNRTGGYYWEYTNTLGIHLNWNTCDNRAYFISNYNSVLYSTTSFPNNFTNGIPPMPTVTNSPSSTNITYVTNVIAAATTTNFSPASGGTFIGNFPQLSTGNTNDYLPGNNVTFETNYPNQIVIDATSDISYSTVTNNWNMGQFVYAHFDITPPQVICPQIMLLCISNNANGTTAGRMISPTLFFDDADFMPIGITWTPTNVDVYGDRQLQGGTGFLTSSTNGGRAYSYTEMTNYFKILCTYRNQ
jgi:hypothetical protein